jgi:SAM-dependent methyltransferase
LILRSFIREAFSKGDAAGASVPAAFTPASTPPVARRLLNVGGFSKSIAIPGYFRGWDHMLLDIDPTVGADVVCDARELETLAPSQFDAIYCSHNLEHYYKHDVIRVLRGFLHVLQPDGFAQIRVPDLHAVFRKVVTAKLDLDDTLYVTRNGQPILVSDVIYGWTKKIEQSGQEFFAHKTGFSPSSLRAALLTAGFQTVATTASEKRFEVAALAFKADTSAARVAATRRRLVG